MEEDGLAARVLDHCGFTAEGVRDGAIAMNASSPPHQTSGQLPFTPRLKKVLELGLREALGLGHNYIGTEHLLLGLVRENEGLGARIVTDKLGENAHEQIRNEIIRLLSGAGARARQQARPTSEPVTIERVADAVRATGFAAYAVVSAPPEERQATLATAFDRLENFAKLSAAYLRGRPKADAD